ncbi:MAG: Hsp20/alpha crystallin family protein, partial [Gammaproteobacteria bacterium]|nr:Hsp20/alpha crystallin family protein [Gammaproteobacteria bacterium]
MEKAIEEQGDQQVSPIKKTNDKPRKIPAPALSPFQDMDQFFNQFFSQGWMTPFGHMRPSWSEFAISAEGKIPNVDIIDRDEEILVRAELPGVEKKDLDITVNDNTITIKGTTHYEQKEEKGDYYRSEISSGSFSRTLSLP